MPKDDKLEYIIGEYYTPGERQLLLVAIIETYGTGII